MILAKLLTMNRMKYENEDWSGLEHRLNDEIKELSSCMHHQFIIDYLVVFIISSKS